MESRSRWLAELLVLWTLAGAGCAAARVDGDRAPVEHVKTGLELERRGRREEAARHYRAALRASGSYIPALIALGNLALERGETARARRYYRRALLVDPDHPGANNNLAMALLAEGRLDEAEILARKALANAGPLDPYVQDTLAQIRERKGVTWHRRSGRERSASASSASP